MSPETGNYNGTMRQEAERIVDMLLADEVKIAAENAATREKHAQTARSRLGYGPPVEANTSDLIDARIEDKSLVIAPEYVSDVLPISANSAVTTREGREAVHRIISGEDERLLVMVGPCSVREEEETMEYTKNVSQWREEFGDELEILMRFYPEKPRTKGREEDWKGFNKDPLLDGSSNINLGLVASRLLVCSITEKGVPLVSERLDANTPQYSSGLIALDIIGARNAYDQNARSYLSGTSAAGSIKNPPDGTLQGGVDAVTSAGEKHAFLGMAMGGGPMLVKTLGNKSVFMTLRGGAKSPNYSADHVKTATRLLREAGQKEAIAIDASHDNTYSPLTGKKEFERQVEVVQDISQQVAMGQFAIKGVMLESNLKEGKQELVVGATNPHELERGVSVTDPCIGLSDTRKSLACLAGSVHARRASGK